MVVTKKIPITEEFSNYIEGLCYEKDNRANLLLFILNNNIEDKEIFNRTQDEYTEFFVKYELSKRVLEETYIEPHVSNFRYWELDFKLKEVSIYE